MIYPGMDEAGLVPYEEPGIANYYTLLVALDDGVFQIDVRRVATPGTHTMPPEEARPATREEAANLMSRMVIACLAAAKVRR